MHNITSPIFLAILMMATLFTGCGQDPQPITPPPVEEEAAKPEPKAKAVAPPVKEEAAKPEPVKAEPVVIPPKPHEGYSEILWCNLEEANQFDGQMRDCFWATSSTVWWTGGTRGVYEKKIKGLPTCESKYGITPDSNSQKDVIAAWSKCNSKGGKSTQAGYSYRALKTYLYEVRDAHGEAFYKCDTATHFGLWGWMCSDEEGETPLTFEEMFLDGMTASLNFDHTAACRDAGPSCTKKSAPKAADPDKGKKADPKPTAAPSSPKKGGGATVDG